MARRAPAEFVETFSALGRCLRSEMSKAYANMEVGSTQAKFLRHIAKNSRISQASLARATMTDPALTGRALETLVERDWVKRTRSEEDRRQYVLELTPAGRRVWKRVDDARTKLASRIAAVIDERDEDDFERIVRKLVEAFPDADASASDETA